MKRLLEGFLCVSILCLIGYHAAACSNPQLNELNYCKTCCPEFSITKPWIDCCLPHTDGSDSNRNPTYLAQRTFDTFAWEAFEKSVLLYLVAYSLCLPVVLLQSVHVHLSCVPRIQCNSKQWWEFGFGLTVNKNIPA